MIRMTIRRVACAAGMASLLGLQLACAGESSASDEDYKAAAALNADGDRAYREGQFNKALKAYMNSYPNHPNAHAYLMAGDSYWRAVLAANPAPDRSRASGACSLTNAYFAQDAARSLEQYFRPGLALVDKEPSGATDAGGLRQRSRAAASCLSVVQRKYEALPRAACVDLQEVAACIGDPLRP